MSIDKIRNWLKREEEKTREEVNVIENQIVSVQQTLTKLQVELIEKRGRLEALEATLAEVEKEER